MKYKDAFDPLFLKDETIFKNTFLSTASQAYSELCQKSKMELFSKVHTAFSC